MLRGQQDRATPFATDTYALHEPDHEQQDLGFSSRRRSAESTAKGKRWTCRFSRPAAYGRTADMGFSDLSHDDCIGVCLTKRFHSCGRSG
jgi:hypothetical protein